MSLSKLLSQRVVKVETQLAAAQNAFATKRPSVFHDVLVEGDRVLQPCMWDWVLETAQPFKQQDRISRIASLLAADKGWEMNGGWGEIPRYWWALRGCTFFYDKLKTEGLFYFFRCSRAEFESLPENVRNEAWAEAVSRLTALLRDPEACAFSRYRPDEARSLVVALSKCNLPELLSPYLPPQKICTKGSREALAAWVNAEYVRQYAKRGHQPA
jgi:hypothetical protein